MRDASLSEILKLSYKTRDFFLVLLYLLVFVGDDLLSCLVCLVRFFVGVDGDCGGFCLP